MAGQWIELALYVLGGGAASAHQTPNGSHYLVRGNASRLAFFYGLAFRRMLVAAGYGCCGLLSASVDSGLAEIDTEDVGYGAGHVFAAIEVKE